MPQLDPYLIFDGNCAEAMRFYEQALGGRIDVMMTHADSPLADDTPPEMAERIMHARMTLDGRILMASDARSNEPYVRMTGFALSLIYPSAAEARKIYDALAEGGEVAMPLQPTFWAEAFGMVVDRFGTPWMINGGTAGV